VDVIYLTIPLCLPGEGGSGHVSSGGYAPVIDRESCGVKVALAIGDHNGEMRIILVAASLFVELFM
jgi:hypothetical protein